MNGFGKAIAVLALSVLVGCSGASGPRIEIEEPRLSDGFVEGAKSTWARWRGLQDPAPSDPRSNLTPALIDAAGVPLMLVETFEPVSYSMFQSVSNRNGRVQWRNASSQGLTTRNGLVTASQGFAFDRMDSDLAPTIAALRGLGPRVGYTRLHRVLDGENQTQVHGYVCDLTRHGSERLVLAGRRYATQIWRESCTGLRETFQNVYWRDQSGIIRASEQWITTGAPLVRLERLTP